MANRQLFTVEEARPFLDLEDDSEDDLISLIIDSVTRQIENYCNCTFEVGGVTYSETYDGNNGVTLYLNHAPIISVSSVVITDSSDVAETIAAADYKIYSSVGKIVLTEGDTFVSGDLNVAITYVAGESTLPPDVKFAGLKLARWYKRKWTDNRDGISSVTVEGQTTSYETGIPEDIKRMLNQYRVPAFG
jgi:hypothetical protein